VHCCDATASSFVAKVRGKVYAHFHAVAINSHSSNRIYCLACQDEFFVKENYENAIDFRSSTVMPFFGLPVIEHSIHAPMYGLCFLPQMLE
jgi:hypothetical protein